MERFSSSPRPDLHEKAEELGFPLLEVNGEPYWDETAYYRFSLRQIEDDLEDPTAALHSLVLDTVDRVVTDERALKRLRIPVHAWDWIAESWRQRAPSLYGRMDFSYDGRGAAKLLEYNADTPTALYEASIFQWHWLNDLKASGVLPAGADQFNSIHEKLLDWFAGTSKRVPLHLAGFLDNDEDRLCIDYIAYCARESGLTAYTLSMGDIGLMPARAFRAGHFIDRAERRIERLFKLYPWEWMLEDQFGQDFAIARLSCLEPLWKAIVSNKGFLALLWEREPGHPNLLPTYFEGEPAVAALAGNYARKPLYSREGGNVSLYRHGALLEEEAGRYGSEGYVRQQLHLLPDFGGNFPVIGSWLIGDQPAGIGIREDATRITRNTSRFVPHIFID